MIAVYSRSEAKASKRFVFVSLVGTRSCNEINGKHYCSEGFSARLSSQARIASSCSPYCMTRSNESFTDDQSSQSPFSHESGDFSGRAAWHLHDIDSAQPIFADASNTAYAIATTHSNSSNHAIQHSLHYAPETPGQAFTILRLAQRAARHGVRVRTG